ncbi:mechanosensitive ion channel domain-containing protein [Spongiivirga sp. MCCC 1A20706]|uniref:mechanosensitive ion channel family protein n=1 Tax=Spongiivirga sp. MCCC 1A20706 TaxID=3160963 RepID=UPI0039772E73
MEKKLSHILYDYLIKIGANESTASYFNMAALFLSMLLLVFICDYVIWKLLRFISSRIAKRSKTNFDDLLIANKLPRFLAHIFPLLLAIEMIPWVFIDFQYVENVMIKIAYILGVVLVLKIVRSLLNTIKDHLKTLSSFKDKPIDSYIQVFMIFAWVAGIMTVFAIITETTIWKFFTALGAASAIILLIFKDTILGFVASIQVSINDMVRIGDWITFEKYGADGDVVEINLATVKVQNFDKTITTIPTYALISDSFKNWRGMNESGGRRIKRALIIKQESVAFLTDEQINELKKIHLISSYLESRGAKISEYNAAHQIDKSIAINGKNLTNLGVFRKYVETYVENHSAINKDMTVMVRQLPPSTQGIPIEIYAFSSDKRWKNYEYIIADIFDHLIASITYFDLELFELPSKTYI